MTSGLSSPQLGRAAAAAAPFALALAIGALVLAATGHEPATVYRLMLEEAFGGERRIAATLTEATPLLLTGLAAAIAFRAGVFNVGAEGCFYLGGIVAAIAGYALPSWPRRRPHSARAPLRLAHRRSMAGRARPPAG